MTKPSSDQLHVAAIWLDCYEGEGTDADACRVVAAWLLEQAEKAELREAAQYSGISMAKLRAIMKSAK